MDQLSLPSFFMVWLHEQNAPLNPNHFLADPQPPQKQLEISNISDDICEKEKMKSHDSNDRQDTESLKSPKKTFSGLKDDKDPDFSLKKQKKNRNVLSNLVHHLLKYLSNRVETEAYVQKLIQHHHMKIQLEEFFMMLENLNRILKSYVTQKNLVALWLGELTPSQKNEKSIAEEFGKIIRILSRKFYKETCRSSIFYSNKLSVESKELHYQGLHEIYELLFSKEKLKHRQNPKANKKK